MLNGVPWWFVEGDAAASRSIPTGRIAAALPFEQIIGCVVHASCSRVGRRRVIVKHADKLIIGEPGGGEPSERRRAAVRVARRAGLRPDLTGNVRRAIWYKLWGNATINPLSALTRATCDKILADPECRAWMLEGMAELAAIGAAIGCPISESGEDRMAVTARLGAFKTSMLQDVEAGRPIELEALLGAPREIARARRHRDARARPALRRHQADGGEPRPRLTRPPARRIRRSRCGRRLRASHQALQRHFVAVLEEAARLAVRQAAIGCLPPWLISSSEPRPPALSVDKRAGADQVAGLEVAAVRAVVGDDLRRAPVHRRVRRPARQDVRRKALARASARSSA